MSEPLTADEVTIGAETVLDVKTARVVTLAGTEFIVTPSFDKGVVETVNCYGVPPLIGVAMSTEAVNAFEAGANMVKVFPAGTLGPGFISALGGLFGHIPTVPTGGVGLDNVDEFFDAGATVVGVGNSVADIEAAARGGFGAIEASTRVFRKVVKAVRSE